MNQGRAEGRAEQLAIIVKKKIEKGLSVDAIAEALEEEVPVIEAIINDLLESAT